MSTRWSATVFRWRRPVVLLSVAVAMSLLAMAFRWPVVLVVLYALAIPPFVVAVGIGKTMNRRRTRTLDIGQQTSTFGTPLLGSGVALAVSWSFCAAATAGAALPAIVEGQNRWSWVAGLGVMVAVGVSVARPAWSGRGVRLSATGITYDGPTCTVWTAWEALDEARPVETVDRFSLRLRYARPDLVRFTGIALDRRQIRFEGVDARFLTEAITYYVTHPERRPTIGIPAELHHLQEAVDTALAPAVPPPTRTPPGRMSIGLAVLVFVAAIVVSADFPVPFVTTFIASLALQYAARGVLARSRHKTVQW